MSDIQQDWQQLVKLCILGTQRQANALATTPIPNEKALAQRYEQWQALSTEQQVLRRISALRTYLLSGQTAWQTITLPQKNLPSANPISTNERYTSKQIDTWIQRSLLAQQDSLLLELLKVLCQKGYVLNPIILSPVLDKTLNNTQLRHYLVPLLGSRGRWLIQQRPDWEKAIFHLLPQQSDQGDKPLDSAQGLAVFAIQLENDTVTALSQLKEHWSQEDAKSRYQRLAMCLYRANLHRSNTNDKGNASDSYKLFQDILLIALKDRSQSIRALATQALIQQALIQKATHTDTFPLWHLLQTFIEQHIQLKRSRLGNTSIDIQAPEQFDAAWKSLGIQEKFTHLPLGQKVGQRAAWLHQLLSLIPIEQLCNELKLENITPLLKAANKHDYSEAILQAWDQAARPFNQAVYHTLNSSLRSYYHVVNTLNEHPAEHPGRPTDNDNNYLLQRFKLVDKKHTLTWLQHIACYYSAEVLEPIIIACTQQVIKKNNDLYQLLLTLVESTPPLTINSAQALLKLLRQRLTTQSDTHYWLRSNIDKLCYQLPLSLNQTTPSITELLSHDNGNPIFESLLENYQQRLALHKELNHVEP